MIAPYHPSSSSGYGRNLVEKSIETTTAEPNLTMARELRGEIHRMALSLTQLSAGAEEQLKKLPPGNPPAVLPQTQLTMRILLAMADQAYTQRNVEELMRTRDLLKDLLEEMAEMTVKVRLAVVEEEPS